MNKWYKTLSIYALIFLFVIVMAYFFMDSQSEQEIKDNFDRLLKVVQDTARERVGRLQGQTMEALVEEVNEQDASLLTGRLSNNTIVHFPGDSSLIGSIVKVNLKECHGFYYIGEMVI